MAGSSFRKGPPISPGTPVIDLIQIERDLSATSPSRSQSLVTLPLWDLGDKHPSTLSTGSVTTPSGTEADRNLSLLLVTLYTFARPLLRPLDTRPTGCEDLP